MAFFKIFLQLFSFRTNVFHFPFSNIFTSAVFINVNSISNIKQNDHSNTKEVILIYDDKNDFILSYPAKQSLPFLIIQSFHFLPQFNLIRQEFIFQSLSFIGLSFTYFLLYSKGFFNYKENHI